MLSQLLAVFGFSSVVLVLIYWINRAVRLFDWLIASGQSATVFLEFTALTLPNVIRIVLPISAFVATLYTVNRLSSESELVVVQATGYGPFRLARPVAVFGIFVASFVAMLLNAAVPTAAARLAERQVEVAENATARLLVEGRFVHPAPGMTLFLREITGSGELRDLYLRDGRREDRVVTYTATRASLVRTESGPRLVMYDGLAQTLDTAGRTLAVTRFEEFALNVTALIEGRSGPRGPTLKEANTVDLLRAPESLVAALGVSRSRIRTEGHMRIAGPLIGLTAPLVGFATLLLGGFSRFGVWNQIFAAVVLVAGLYMFGNAMEDLARTVPGGWPLVYLPPIAGLGLAAALLWLAGRPHLLRWRRRREAAA